MTLTVFDTETDFDRGVAARVSRQVLLKPDSLLGLATGNTTLNIYTWMVKFHKELGVDYSRAKTCNLDEYVGVAAGDPKSCRYRIDQSLLKQINIKYENTYVPDGLAKSPEQELGVFKKTVECFGGIDLQILSIGANGHIAFNEPGTPFETTYRIAPISENTMIDKAGLFGGKEKVPHHGLTMGIRDIMAARKILLVAKGAGKEPVIRKILDGVLTTGLPASVLLLHPDVEIMVDRKAAGTM